MSVPDAQAIISEPLFSVYAWNMPGIYPVYYVDLNDIHGIYMVQWYILACTMYIHQTGYTSRIRTPGQMKMLHGVQNERFTFEIDSENAVLVGSTLEG